MTQFQTWNLLIIEIAPIFYSTEALVTFIFRITIVNCSLHTAHVESSKRPEDAAIQFVSRQDIITMSFSQNVYCSLLDSSCSHVSSPDFSIQRRAKTKKQKWTHICFSSVIFFSRSHDQLLLIGWNYYASVKHESGWMVLKKCDQSLYWHRSV